MGCEAEWAASGRHRAGVGPACDGSEEAAMAAHHRFGTMRVPARSPMSIWPEGPPAERASSKSTPCLLVLQPAST